MTGPFCGSGPLSCGRIGAAVKVFNGRSRHTPTSDGRMMPKHAMPLSRERSMDASVGATAAGTVTNIHAESI